jgi:uncharacterized surface protein with fasciclin (FAS1) repeats
VRNIKTSTRHSSWRLDIRRSRVVVVATLPLLYTGRTDCINVRLGDLDQVLNVFGDRFTLAGPTNAAFQALGDGTLMSLRDPKNQASLIRILKYHIVPRVITSIQLFDGASLDPLSGSIQVSVIRQTVRFNQATATSNWVTACNFV